MGDGGATIHTAQYMTKEYANGEASLRRENRILREDIAELKQKDFRNKERISEMKIQLDRLKIAGIKL